MRTLDEILIAEATEYEFKLSLEVDKPRSWLKTVSAFANGLGGSLYFGVDDDRAVAGLPDAQKTAEKISELIVARVEPSLHYKLESLSVEGKEILRLSINGGGSTPYYYKSGDNRTAYYRSGNESVKVTDRLLTELILKGSHRTFDALDSDYLYADHSFTLLNSAYKKNTGETLALPDDLISFGLLGKENHLTYAGALFADYCPVYNSRVFCTRWSGLTMRAGLIDALDDAEHSANVITLVKNGVEFMGKHNHVMWEVKKLLRLEYPDYPQEAMREALINAIIHRNYSVMGSEVHIDIYDDRIEITSPGGMYDSKPIQNYDLRKVPSTRRNPVIADLFQRLDYAERRGSGIKKILRGYEGKERQPEFYSDESMFRTTLYNLNYGVRDEFYGKNGKNVTDIVSDNVQNSKTKNVQEKNRDVRLLKLTDLLREDGSATQDSLASRLGVSTKTIQRDLDALKKQERIERVGSDTSGRWIVHACHTSLG
jgi:predicted HTH transcriptional regulator